MTVLLVGDSNLARLYYELPDLVPQAFGADVECRAAGGAWSGSLRQQIGDRAAPDYKAVVVSIGSSDSHTPYGSSPAAFRENLSRELESGGRWIALLPRDLVRALDPSETDEVNTRIRTFSGILAELVKASGGIRTLSDARTMLEAGASRIGASASVRIVEELSLALAATPATAPI